MVKSVNEEYFKRILQDKKDRFFNEFEPVIKFEDGDMILAPLSPNALNIAGHYLNNCVSHTYGDFKNFYFIVDKDLSFKVCCYIPLQIFKRGMGFINKGEFPQIRSSFNKEVEEIYYQKLKKLSQSLEIDWSSLKKYIATKEIQNPNTENAQPEQGLAQNNYEWPVQRDDAQQEVPRREIYTPEYERELINRLRDMEIARTNIGTNTNPEGGQND